MTFLLLAAVLIVGVLVLLSLLRRSAGPARSAAAAPGGQRPPGTRDLDEETAARPEIDPQALAHARAQVSPAVPDAVLSDALLDATPGQVARLFSAVPTSVMADALGASGAQAGKVQVQGQATAQDMAQLRGLGDALDDLDIWSFGDDTTAKPHKA
ncbi:hypothetical protein SAMN04488058_12122 [Deinococcus reticulitermitis]|uniref:Uncharacterized protein n=1 Tax=Deinococcus reticulitermitis TaxID=856736 RepID=A0A1H7C7D4_9DEIO|nr:hypothetical protein [Deinococcus reticulitermitis]SEJ82972.1 hypothetical protein SAMN04488058_12122 [Deinococcus reticulitermitis]